MEMPRSRSSRSRSVFLPVSAVIECGLAVVDVPGRAQRERRPRDGISAGPAHRGRRLRRGAASTARGELLELGVADGAQVEQQLAVLHAADHGRLAARAVTRPAAGVTVRRRTATATLGTSVTGSAPAPARATVSTSVTTPSAARTAPLRLREQSAQALGAGAHHVQRRRRARRAWDALAAASSGSR